MKLYDFQKDCVKNLHHKFKTNRAVCLAWYTGSGKTNIFSEFCKEVIKKNPKVKIGISAYFTIEIKEQVTERLGQFDMIDVCQMIKCGEPINTEKNIFIFNPQTIYRREDELEFDYFIIDESHSGLSTECKMLRKILKKFCCKDVKILIVSATPWDTLSLKEFEGCPVLKRPLDQGIKDGLTTDFKFHAEEAQITFVEDDFTRKGDLGSSAAQRRMSILKSACIGKMEYLLGNYKKELGEKILVICPPGNKAEVARTMATHFGGLAFIETHGLYSEEFVEQWMDTKDNLHKFMKEPKQRFLFVVNKCQVGFDMRELSSVVDLTMSRNIQLLAQRCGRIARKSENQKHYFYVYDKSMTKIKLEWLVSTMIDFCLGAYDGWTTKTAKWRKSYFNTWFYKKPYAFTLMEVIDALSHKDNMHTKRCVSFVQVSRPTKWTVASAIEAAKKYPNRTELWDKRPAVYKWLRLNAKDAMDELFPLRSRNGFWNKKTVIEAMKKSKTRMDFNIRFGGADYWLQTQFNSEEREKFKSKYLPESKSKIKWTTETVNDALIQLRRWSDVRSANNGLRAWMRKNGGENKYKLIWLEMPPLKANIS